MDKQQEEAKQDEVPHGQMILTDDNTGKALWHL
jgi:hypothetical protein